MNQNSDGMRSSTFGRLDVLVVNAPERINVAAPRSRAAFGWCAEFLQMDVADSGVIERSSKLALGKTRPARRRHGASVDQYLDLRALELVENSGGLCLLVTDGVERPRFRGLGPSLGLGLGFGPGLGLGLGTGFHFIFSISAMAAAGARIFASWMK